MKKEDILSCKHGIYKQSCSYCNSLDDTIVKKEKDFTAVKNSWNSSTFSALSAFNSAAGDQDYDLEEKKL